MTTNKTWNAQTFLSFTVHSCMTHQLHSARAGKITTLTTAVHIHKK